jgi:hypothetical protein
MSSPQPPSAREVLIESLGGLSAQEKEELFGPNWASFAGRKVEALRDSRKWVIALGITMGLLSVALPTTAFYHYYQATESFTILEFLAPIAGACLFAAVQAGWAVRMYLRWRHQLQCYRGLQALGRQEEADEPAPEPA